MLAVLGFIAAAAGTVQDSARLTLSQSVDRALAAHPAIAAARAMHDRAGADVGDARALRRPRLSFDAGLTQFEEPMVVLPLHGFDPRNPPLFDRSLVQAGVSASWTIHDFGRRAARLRVQEALDDAAGAAVSTTQRQVIARTASAYVRVLTARGILAAQTERIAALTAAGERVRQLVGEGKAARVEQLRIDAEARRAEADRIAAASQLTVAEHELAQLADTPVATIHRSALGALRAGDAALATDTSVLLRDALVARARATSSDVQELRSRAQATSAALAAAKTLKYPELRASGGYIDRGRLKGDFAGEWQVGVAVAYPLYTGGSRGYTIERAAADDRAATAQLHILEDIIETGIDRALAAIRDAHARSAALQAAVEQSAEVSRIERLSVEVGSGTQSDFLDAEANLLRARASLIEARHAEIAARVELARLTGELSPEWIARTMEASQ